jgi:hypothetical protein
MDVEPTPSIPQQPIPNAHFDPWQAIVAPAAGARLEQDEALQAAVLSDVAQACCSHLLRFKNGDPGAVASRETGVLPCGNCMAPANADPESGHAFKYKVAVRRKRRSRRETAEARLTESRGGRVYFATGAATSSSVTTKKRRKSACPNEVVMATSEASRPVAIRTRPIRDWLLRASNVHQRPSR